MPYVVMLDRKDGTDKVICGELDDSGKPLRIFDTGQEAGEFRAEMARMYAAYAYSVTEYVAVRDMQWMVRESRRLDGQYTRTPWQVARPDWWLNHTETSCLFEHMSAKHPGMVSYTENADKGEQDKQAPAMAPGRFLKKFYSDVLKDEDIERWVAKCAALNGEIELQVTADADTIEAVFTNGPRSCMAGTDFMSNVHPARVYAGPDLAVAYLGDPEDGVSARCVVWPAKQRYSTIYGDISRMELALKAAGYERGSTNGARIQRIEHDEGNDVFVVPYVDGANYACEDDDGEYLIIGGGCSDISLSMTDGLSCDMEEDTTSCDDCGDRVHDEDTRYIESLDRTVCEHCCANNYTYIHQLSAYYRDDEITEVFGRSRWDHCPTDQLGDHDFIEIENGPHAGEYWYCDSVTTCETCDSTFHEDDNLGPVLADDCDGYAAELLEGDHCEGCCTNYILEHTMNAHVLQFQALTPLEQAIHNKEPANDDHRTDPAFAGNPVLVETPRQLHGEGLLQGVLGHSAGDAIGPVWQSYAEDTARYLSA
ncbi:hypothetical protein [Aquisediminimonas sediminicola]|uniref:hypothetical protein n=1 Tax=Alteraquisediminimonas sediminicola TaxID=2676787 RepID=UPI001C8D7712|nr:hypothetical protein [Aquisediminimonas sediminicola]